MIGHLLVNYNLAICRHYFTNLITLSTHFLFPSHFLRLHVTMLLNIYTCIRNIQVDELVANIICIITSRFKI